MSRSLLEKTDTYKKELQALNYIFKTLFVKKPRSRVPVRQAQTIMLFLSKMSNSVENIKKIGKFFIDKGVNIKYNRGYRYYKDYECTLHPDEIIMILREQKTGIFNKVQKYEV